MKLIIWKFQLFAVLFISAAWLGSCQGLSKPTATPTATFTFTQTNTSTQTQTITSTPTFTPTETITPTITLTLTATPAYNAPGSYSIGKCTYFAPAGAPNAQVTFCVNTVIINDDLTMQFNVRWGIKAGGYLVTKHSDTNNYNMYLMDDLGNKYQHIGVGGCAAIDIRWTNEGDCNGWFLFPPAKTGAKSFRFYDWDNLIYVDNIVLVHGDFPTLTNTPKPTKGSYNSPGTYWIYKCTYFVPQSNFPEASNVTLCVNTVVINEAYEMRFNVNWKINYGYVNTWSKLSDANNNNIFLEDNLENTYQHILTGGCAGQDMVIIPYGTSGDCNGWFQFPRAKPGATSFRFVDLANHAAIENIILLPK